MSALTVICDTECGPVLIDSSQVDFARVCSEGVSILLNGLTEPLVLPCTSAEAKMLIHILADARAAWQVDPEALLVGEYKLIGRNLKYIKPPDAGSSSMWESIRSETLQLAEGGTRKIAAIKHLRTLCPSLSLKTAKHIVEDWLDNV